MAEVSDSDSDFVRPTKEEEEWPDIDVDSQTSEGAEAIRRADAAFEASMERSLQQRLEQEPGHGRIPEALYIQAFDHQDQLTHEERQLLLSRGDIVGKALAYPDSLTRGEIHELMFWPPPDILRDNVQRATGGTLSTPEELFAKAKDALDRGQFDTAINDDEAARLFHHFYPLDDPTDCEGRAMQALSSPGYKAAYSLMAKRVGHEVDVFKAAAARCMPLGRPPSSSSGATAFPALPAAGLGTSAVPQTQSAPPQSPLEILSAMESNYQQFARGNITKEAFLARDDELTAMLRNLKPNLFQTDTPVRTWPGVVQWPESAPRPLRSDLFGSGPWPDTYEPRGAFHLFWEENGLSEWDVEPGWRVLPEEHKEAYRARAEAARQMAWAQFEGILATPPSTRLENHLWSSARGVRLPPRTLNLVVTGFELFWDGLPEERLGYQEVVRRWEALSREGRKEYEERARERHREVCAALPSDYLDNRLRERMPPHQPGGGRGIW